MSTPVPLLALALALCGLILLVALNWHRRWLELALVFLVGCALALHLERGRRGPDRIGKLVAEVVNADRSISLHIQVGPGAAVWCSSVFSVEAAPAGEPARESADWFVDLHPTERSDAKPLNADAAGRAVVTLPASQVESAPNLAVRIRFNGNDQGTTRLDPATNAAPVYLASMLDLGSSSTARNQEIVTAEGVWLANLSDRHPGGCIRTIRALLATNGVEVSIDVLPGTKMKTVPTSNGIVRLEPVKLREWVNHEKVLVPFADVPCVVQLEKWADVFGNEAWSRVLLERRDPSAATLPPPRIETAFSSKSSRDAPFVLAATNRSDRAVALLAVETVAGKHKSGFRANPAILRLAPGEGGTIEIRRDPFPLGTPILTLFDLSSGIRVPVAEFPATP